MQLITTDEHCKHWAPGPAVSSTPPRRGNIVAPQFNFQTAAGAVLASIRGARVQQFAFFYKGSLASF